MSEKKIISIHEYVDKAEQARQNIINTAHGVGYIIPTDSTRKAAGEETIPLSEIYLWLYKRAQSLLIVDTTSTNYIQITRFVLNSIPDCQVQWDYDPVNPDAGIEQLSDCISDNLIQHTWSETKSHKIAFFSPSRMNRITDSIFMSNSYVKNIKLTPVVTNLGNAVFRNASNLESVEMDTGNLTCIMSTSFYENKVKTIVLPDSVKRIDGSDTFYINGLQSFVINETSQLEELHGGWIFNFYDRATNNEYIYIPSRIKLFSTSNPTEQMTWENVDKWINGMNPFSRSCNRFKIGKDPLGTEESKKTDKSKHYMTDKYGIVYVKNEKDEPKVILYFPWYDIFDEYKIPSTVTMIANMAMMDILTNGHPREKTGTRQVPFTIPKQLEYISPNFEHWGSGNFKFTVESGNKYYRTTSHGGLMTYSNKEDAEAGKDPDVLIYEPVLGSYSNRYPKYEFPSSFADGTDFRGYTSYSNNWIRYNSWIDEVVISKNFPKFPGYQGNTSCFRTSPCKKFSIASGNTRYKLDGNGCLYMNENHYGIAPTDYSTFVAMPYEKNLDNFKLPDGCCAISDNAFVSRRYLTGTLDFNNVVYAESYQGVHYTQVSQVKFSNKTKRIVGWQFFSDNDKLTCVTVGTDRNSELTVFGQHRMFTVNPNLTDVWIYSTRVSSTVGDLVPIRMNTDHGVSIHIPFYTTDRDGATVETTTYKTFLKYGFSTVENTSTGVKLVNIPE